MRTALLLTLWLLLGFTAAAQPGAIVLEAGTDRKYYRENARSEIHVDARVMPAPAAAAAPQKPAVRNIALVLDRSGSMAGEPLAELRRAVTGALELIAEDDFLAVVFFGSEVETLIESQPRNRIRDLDTRLAGLETAGGAALYDALNQGAAQLRRNAGPATLEQLILVTDGPPTKGPREVEDFARLAEALGREGIQLSTVGLGPDFNEDMLAAMARTAHGNFRYAQKPAALAVALEAELRPRPVLLGRDAVLTVDFIRATRMLRSYGWREPVLGERSLTFHIPRLLSTTLPSVLVSAEAESFDTRFDLLDFAKVQLTWKAVDSDQTHRLTQTIPAKFSTDTYDLREPLANHVARAGASAVARANLQKAIEALDKNDPRRAVRQLRTLRSEVRDLNYDLDDRELNDLLRAIDAFLPQFPSATTSGSTGYSSSASSSSSSIGAQRSASPASTGHDRKMLRSGMAGLFAPPAAPVEAKRLTPMAAPLPELSGAIISAATRRRRRQALLLGVSFAIAAVGAGLAVHRLYQTAEREVREQSELARRQAVVHAQDRVVEETERLRNSTLAALAALHSEGLSHALQRWDASDAAINGTFQWEAAQGFSPTTFPQHPTLAHTEIPALWQSAKLDPRLIAAEASLGDYQTRLVRMIDNPAFPTGALGYQAENIEIVTYAGGRAQPLAGWAAHTSRPEVPWIFWYQVGPDMPVRGCFVDLRLLLARLREELLDTRLARVSLSLTGRHDSSSTIADLAGSLPGYVLVSSPGDLFVEKQSATRLTALTAGGVLGVFILGAAGLVAYARREMREAEQKATFVTHVSHELRTPLTSIRMFADMLAAPEISVEKRAKFADTISRESARLGNLIERLLTFNALEKGKHAVALAPVDVAGVVRETLEEMDSALRASGLQVETELPTETVIATTDRGTLKQALLNLLDNAQKYACSGGSVRVSLQTQPEQVRVRVADAGPGIARGLGAKIFDPFVQGGRTLTDKTPGIGLGLSIARGLLRAAGGDVVLLPSERGATFEIRLPRTLSS